MQGDSARPPVATPSNGPARAGRHRPGWQGDGLVLLLMPLVLLALDGHWIWSGPGRDNWIYYGYFRFARVYLEQFRDVYYSSRLSVILPGYLLRRLLPPLAANLVLHFGLYWLAVGAFYLTARAFVGRRAALLAVLVLGSQPYFLLAIGWNYVDGFGLAYFLAAAACLTLAAGQAVRPGGPPGAEGPESEGRPLLGSAPSRGRTPWGRRSCLALAGAAATALVSANLFYTVYLPLLAAGYLALLWPLPLRQAWRDLLWVIAGAAGAFCVLGLANRFGGHGYFLFLLPSARWLARFSRAESGFKHPASQWLRGALWLAFPLLILLSSLATLLRGLLVRLFEPASRLGRLVLFTQLQYVAFFALMAAVELGPQGVTFEYHYYASLLLAPACLALAGQVALLVAGIDRRTLTILAAACVAALAISQLPLLPARAMAALAPTSLLPPVLAGAGCLMIITSGRRGLRPALLFLLLLAGAQLLIKNLGGFRESWRPFHHDAAGLFHQIDSTLSVLQRADPSLQVRIWYNQEEDRAHYYLFDTVASALLICPHLVNFSFPDGGEGRLCGGQPFAPGLTIAVLSARQDAAAAALATLTRFGLHPRLRQRVVVPGPAPPFAILVIDT